MRFINCTTITLEECFGDDIPPYAILSHTLGIAEVTFAEFTIGRHVLQQECRPKLSASLNCGIVPPETMGIGVRNYIAKLTVNLLTQPLHFLSKLPATML
jgi:hypothetical protein